MIVFKIIFNFLIGSVYELFHKTEKSPIYGIEGYFGLMGSGKTICMTHRLNKLRKKYGNKIYIITNYGYKYEDETFKHWSQLFVDHGIPLVVAWDEVQNEFNSRNFKDFPTELLTILTQVRKRNGVLLLYSAQRIQRVDKVFRELTMSAWNCHSFGRCSWAFEYDAFRMVAYENMVGEDKGLSIKPKGSVCFMQTDKLRSDYNSFQLLESATGRLTVNDRIDIKSI